ncbi:hypothetical protein AAZX31_02G212000 [Glycine max]|nr:hypothetical protein GLYMA_02G226366v4 [Glycine max]
MLSSSHRQPPTQGTGTGTGTSTENLMYVRKLSRSCCEQVVKKALATNDQENYRLLSTIKEGLIVTIMMIVIMLYIKAVIEIPMVIMIAMTMIVAASAVMVVVVTMTVMMMVVVTILVVMVTMTMNRWMTMKNLILEDTGTQCSDRM